MKTINSLAATIVVSIIFGFISISPNLTSGKFLIKPTDTVPDSLDLTAFFKQINDNSNIINTQFKAGKVDVADLNPELKKTETGFEIQLGATNIPSPVIYKGKVFVSGGFGSRQYYAFDAQTGKKIWAINLDDDGPSSAAIVDDIIVFNTESCTLFACKVETGEQIWSYWLGDPLMSMPTISNGIVFTSYPSGYGSFNQNKIENIQNKNSQQLDNNKEFSNTHHKNSNIVHQISHVLIAIELRTGKILWQKRIDGDVMSAPVAEGDELYLSTFAGTLIKFKQRTGEIISAKSVRATPAPVIDKGQVYISQRSDKGGEDVSESLANYSSGDIQEKKVYNKKYAPYLDRKIQERSKLKDVSVSQDAGNGFTGGAPVSSNWMVASENIGQSNVSSLQSFQGSRALHHGNYNYNTMGDELICIDVKSGKETWKQKIQGDIHSEGGFMGTPPIMAGNQIILASFSGEIITINPKDGKQLNKYKLADNIRYQPVVEDGWIYVTTTTGKLIAINTSNKELTGWPMWGANPARTNKVK